MSLPPAHIHLAHISHWARPSSGVGWFVPGALVAFTLLLVVAHVAVKHGRSGFVRLRVPVAALVVLSLAAVIAPVPAQAQASGEIKGLPDLISDPSYIWFLREIEGPDGPRLVMSFDGYLHNIGEGNLDVAGNPQVPGDMKQRVFDGEKWTEVGSPTVRFETDDGHNHFHLISAVGYALWDEAQTTEVGDASKIGFCLLDTELVDERYDEFYNIDTFKYCQVDNPDATELRMGISPGWRDTYDANTTLQWVDVSDVTPGRYWVAATTDPNDEIVESDESNNGVVFSTNKFAVDGYVARPLPTQTAAEPITLKADPFGTVGRRAFVIVDGPKHGSLNVPVGADLLGNEVTYLPDAGYEGPDEFSYVARDTDSRYPWEPTAVKVAIDVASTQPPPSTQPNRAGNAQIVAPTSAAGTIYDSVEYAAQIDNYDGPIRWFGKDLPPGVVIDETTGVITGIPSYHGEFESTLIAQIGRSELTHQIAWSIAEQDLPAIFGRNDFSTSRDDPLRMYLGFGNPDAAYEGSGLPEGTLVVTNLPILTGTPEEVGSFDIIMRERIDGKVTNEFRFTWTVRPLPIPAFPL